MSNPESLWPDLPTVPRKAPLTLIKEQASHLGQLTQNIIEAAVSRDLLLRDGVRFRFSLICQALGGYTVDLFKFVITPTQLYPIQLESPFLSEENDHYEVEVYDEEQLKKALGRIFSHRKTVSAIEAILSQTNIETVKQEAQEPSDEVPF